MCLRRWLAVVLPLALLCACGGDDGSGNDQSGAQDGAVSQADFEADGRTWPLTVESGTLACERGTEIVFTADGTTYAVNGSALAAGDKPEIDAIWADNPEIPGSKVNISDLITAGQELCD
jgi:hypothetical protein